MHRSFGIKKSERLDFEQVALNINMKTLDDISEQLIVLPSALICHSLYSRTSVQQLTRAGF